jgi:hypothetical protein
MNSTETVPDKGEAASPVAPCRSPIDLPAKGRKRRLLFGAVSIALAAAVWLPALHWLYNNGESSFHTLSGVPPHAQRLAGRHLISGQILVRRSSSWSGCAGATPNGTSRSFLVWSLAEMLGEKAWSASRRLA